MYRNIIYCFIVILVFFACSGCDTTIKCKNVNDQEPHRDLIGKHYIVLNDYYIVQVKVMGHSIRTLYPCGERGMPKELDKKQIGNIINGVRIIGVIPKKSEFKLTRINRCDLVGHINVIILVPYISFLSGFNNVEASALMPAVRGYNFRFDKKLAKETNNSFDE